MPELDFKGKEFVRNHHLTVPYRPLVPDASKSVGEPDLDGNLIIHGDNLEALKALLPKYAGKVDCIFIDPPYNTGNEGWSYNDNVNSPLLKAWFKDNPVGIDDGLRHDKWCCMMWPRLKLLQELLSEEGILWITIDDFEVHRLKILVDEVFGPDSVLGEFVWKSRRNPDNRNTSGLSNDHEYLICVGPTILGRRRRTDTEEDSGNMVGKATIDRRPRLHYCFKNPITDVWYDCPPKGWLYQWSTMWKLIENDRILWPSKVGGRPRERIIRSELSEFTNVSSLLTNGAYTDDGTRQVTAIFGENAFDFPKPIQLVEFVLFQMDKSDSIVLDSFAGSGTTAHAVLSLNAKDGGERKFILVECEEYADTLTAERIRRVINGYAYQGTQRETLLERKLTWTELKKGDVLKQEAENTKAMYEGDYDAVKITVDDGVLKVIGERNVKETAPGLSGSFTYCTLGRALKVDEMLAGKDLPSREALGEWLLYVAGTGAEREKDAVVPKELTEHYLAKQGGTWYWFLYRADREWLKSHSSALTLDLARAIAKCDPKAEHRVFAPQKFVSNKLLRAEGLNLEFAAIPFALFRRGGE